MMNKVRFGIRVPAFPLNDSHSRIFRNEIIDYLAASSERYSSVWVADHFVPWYDQLDPTTDTLECWTTLTYLAGRFPGFYFGSIVLSQSYRSPALLAKMAATLQLLTGGRFILGIGAGWKEDEYLAYGHDFPATATRIHQMGEAVQIIKRMWDNQRANFQGKYYQIEEAICEPKPDPPPPILIGGGGKKITLRYVAQYAEWWNFPGGTPDHYAELLTALRDHCTEVGRDYHSIVKTWGSECVSVAETHEEALKIALTSPLYNPDTAIVGTPAEVETQLRRFTEMDVEHIILRFADFPQTTAAQLFADEVIPKFSG